MTIDETNPEKQKAKKRTVGPQQKARRKERWKKKQKTQRDAKLKNAPRSKWVGQRVAEIMSQKKYRSMSEDEAEFTLLDALETANREADNIEIAVMEATEAQAETASTPVQVDFANAEEDVMRDIDTALAEARPSEKLSDIEELVLNAIKEEQGNVIVYPDGSIVHGVPEKRKVSTRPRRIPTYVLVLPMLVAMVCGITVVKNVFNGLTTRAKAAETSVKQFRQKRKELSAKLAEANQSLQQLNAKGEALAATLQKIITQYAAVDAERARLESDNANLLTTLRKTGKENKALVRQAQQQRQQIASLQQTNAEQARLLARPQEISDSYCIERLKKGPLTQSPMVLPLDDLPSTPGIGRPPSSK